MYKPDIKAIAFDFGNTLCRWDEEQYWEISKATLDSICTLVGTDLESALDVFKSARDEDSARNLPNLDENDITWVWRETAERLSGRVLKDAEICEVRAAHVKAFVGVCCLTEGLPALLEQLSGKYRLVVLSNYPVSECIRQALETMGISQFFEKVLVSGDFGIVKPSREIFGEMLTALNLPPENVLYVGDDPIADIVGAWASGLPCVQIMNGNHTRKAKMLHGVFGTYLRMALNRPDFANWKNAKPIGILPSVLELNKWLTDRSA